jgi:homopolymeric O-antigen transport system permease protein
MAQPRTVQRMINRRSSGPIQYLNPIQFVRSLWRHRELIGQFTRREIVSQYKESFLGLFWVLFTPLFLLLIYTFVFGIVFRRRWVGDSNTSLAEFALILFCGFATFNIFGDIVNHAPRLVVGIPSYVKKIVFPLEILSISSLGSALFHGLMRLSVLLIANLLINDTVYWTVLLLPLVLLPLVLLSLGASWLLASLGVFFRDLHQGVSLFVQALLFFSATLFPISVVPEPYQPIMQINPLTSIVENARLVILWGQLPNWGSLTGWTLIAGIFMMLCYAWFMVTKPAFADVI